MLINIHLLQNYAPSSLNRDDTGSPKDTIFGGVLRARTSSQSLKRSIRLAEGFRNEFLGSAELFAKRSQWFPEKLAEKLKGLGLDETAITVIAKRATEFGRSEDNSSSTGQPAKKGSSLNKPLPLVTKQLIFFTDTELDQIAKKMKELFENDPKGFEKMEREKLERAVANGLPRSVDIAMFGRMTTSAAFEDVAASVQVAHAISTHRIEQEFDYYTAVDDIPHESGAGFIGDTPFNSATYYKYFNIHWDSLLKNLAGDADIARQAVIALIKAACTAHPSGKQNSFAAHNLPDVILVEVRPRNVPVSYANAFQKPVRATAQTSLMEASAQALASYMEKLNSIYDLESDRAYISTLDEELPGSRTCKSLKELVGWLEPQLTTVAGKDKAE